MSDKSVVVFTDGACSGNPGPGGWGAILRSVAHETELSGGARNTTNNRMELMAVIEGLKKLKREGVIAKLGATPSEAIEVQVGIVKVRVGMLDLRKTRGAVATTTAKPAKQKSAPSAQQDSKPQLPDFVPQTPRNTLDLRGSDADTAVDRSLNFIDKCMLSGEKFAVIIHGNGSDRLKSSIRLMLRSNCPYNVSFRPGEAGEGGDGVTVIAVD